MLVRGCEMAPSAAPIDAPEGVETWNYVSRCPMAKAKEERTRWNLKKIH